MNLNDKYYNILERIVCILVGFALGMYFAVLSNMSVYEDNKVDLTSTINRDLSLDKVDIEVNNNKSRQSKYVIYVDAGHGFDINEYNRDWKYGFCEYGAIGESEYVEDLAHILKERLEVEGYVVKLLSDFEIEGQKASREFVGNTGRRDLFKNSNCNVMIQLHYDASDDITCRGGHIIYSPMSLGSKSLAECIVKEFKNNNLRLNEMYKDTNYISKRDGLSIYNKLIEKPIILVECGYGCEGALDYKYLNDDNTKKRLVDAITEGLNTYFYTSIIN